MGSPMPAIALLLIAGIPLASADVPVAPPMDLTATAAPEGVRLTWAAPVGASSTTYKVYRDGVLLDGNVDGLFYLDESSPSTSANFYAVTAVTAFGESLPAVAGFLGGDCVSHNPNATIPYTIDPLACIGQ